MEYITLLRGEIVTVDDEDYEFLNQFKWRLGSSGYAVTGASTCLHVVLMSRYGGYESETIDHIDLNKLNNCKSNLRLASHSQNLANRSKFRNNSSGYKGIFKDRGRWTAQIQVNKKKISSCGYKTPYEAALAYDKLSIEHFKEFANTNFEYHHGDE